MMISLTYRIITLSLAALMLTTSFSFAVDMHYCKGELKSLSIFGKAKTCHEKRVAKVCPHHQKMQQQADQNTLENNCCQNETTYVQADIEQVSQNLELADFQQFVINFTQVLHFSQYTEKRELAHVSYKPPLIQKDIPVLIQSFLL